MTGEQRATHMFLDHVTDPSFDTVKEIIKDKKYNFDTVVSRVRQRELDSNAAEEALAQTKMARTTQTSGSSIISRNPMAVTRIMSSFQNLYMRSYIILFYRLHYLYIQYLFHLVSQ